MHPSLLPATTFGLGYMRPAPGTWGSLPPCALAAAMVALNATAIAHAIAQLALAILFSLACLVAGRHAEQRWGKDPSNVVADETAGQALALLWLPFLAWLAPSAAPAAVYLAIAASFFVFRALDILKPWPARQLQALPTGLGILIDDLIVGAEAAALVALGLALLI